MNVSPHGLPTPNDGNVRQVLDAVVSTLNELQGAVGAAGDRALRLGEMFDAGLLQRDADGLVSKGATIRNMEAKVFELTGSLSATTDAIESLVSGVDRIGEEVVAFARKVTQLTTKLEFTTKGVDGVEKKIRAGSEAVQRLESEVRMSQDAIISQSQFLTQLTSEIAANNGALAFIGEGVAAQAEATALLTTRVEATEDSIEIIAADVVTLGSSLEVVDSTLDGFVDDLSATSDAVNLLTTRVTAAEGAITSSADSVTRLEADLDATVLAANAAAQAAQAAALVAAQGAARLEAMAADSILSAAEKPPVIQDYETLMAERDGIRAQATAAGLTTELAAYDSAVTALTGYLDTLTTPTRWDDTSGDTLLT